LNLLSKYINIIIEKFAACNESPLGIDSIVSLFLTPEKYLFTVKVGLSLPIIFFKITVIKTPIIT
jgi:hypothetical protein